MDDRIFIDEYPVIDRSKDARRDFLADKKISVGDGGYELGETIDEVVCVDNIDHSADFLNPPYLDEKVLTCDPYTGDMFFVNDLAFQKFCYIFNKITKELQKELEKLEPAEPVYDISWIRKRMKCCKNPMERKQLEKQLNEAYKARKKARKKK